MSDLRCCYTDEDCASCPCRRLPGLPMCQRHMLQTFRDALVEGQLPADVFADLVRQTDTLLGLGKIQRRSLEEAAITAHLKASEQAKQARIAEREESSVVYYVGLTQDRIKIGTTTELAKRMQAFRSHPDDLLAVEIGGRVKELERHRQFAHLRIGRDENFKAGPDLLSHIAQLAGSG